jgi:hypothetical protein
MKGGFTLYEPFAGDVRVVGRLACVPSVRGDLYRLAAGQFNHRPSPFWIARACPLRRAVVPPRQVVAARARDHREPGDRPDEPPSTTPHHRPPLVSEKRLTEGCCCLSDVLQIVISNTTNMILALF